MKGKCPNCGEIIEFPYEDRIDVILFGNWKKYHKDKDCNPSKRRIENESKRDVAVLPSEEAKKAWTQWGYNHGYSNYQEFQVALNKGEIEEELRWFTDFDISKGFHKNVFNPSLREK